MTTVVVAIVVNVLLAVSSTLNIVALPIVAMRNLAFDAIGAAIVGNVAHLATKILPRLVQEVLLQPLDLLAVKQAIEAFSAVESLEKHCDRLEHRVLQHFTAKNKLLAVAFMVRHIIPLERERTQWFWDVASGQKLSDAKHLFEPLHVQMGGVTRSFIRQ